MRFWLRFLGIVAILLGGFLFWSPRVAFSSRERLDHSRVLIRRERFFLVPRVAAGLIVGTGVLVLVFARGAVNKR